nr:HEPN domain-containing protein [uncultured Azospirillum sp.]
MFYTLNHFKSVLANEFFVEPADQNYQLARWAKIHGFHREFYWQAVQAIEKYCKAVLVLNGDSVISYGHNIEKLFNRCCKKLGELVVQRFERPAEFPQELWSDEDPGQFLRFLYQQGNPNSRYGMTSWFNRPSDLVKLDCLVFSLRRCAIGIDWVVGTDFSVNPELLEFTGKSFAEVLRAKPTYQVREGFRIVSSPAILSGENIADSLTMWNFQIASTPSNLDRPLPPSMSTIIGPARNSLLHIVCNAMNKHQGKEIDKILREGAAWILDTIRLDTQAMELFKSYKIL